MNKPALYWIAGGIVVIVGAISLMVPPREMAIKRTTEPSPALRQAIAEAKRRLPEFTRALQAAKPGDQFAVRARFTTPVGNEYLWLKDAIPSPKGFLGLIDQAPAFLKEKKKGDLVLVTRADIVDWMAKTADGTIGGFTNGLE
jgi:uncharacterized protein YegJ (DUF2314 family)